MVLLPPWGFSVISKEVQVKRQSENRSLDPGVDIMKIFRPPSFSAG